MLEYLQELEKQKESHPYSVQFGDSAKRHKVESVDSLGIVTYEVDQYDQPAEARPWTSVGSIKIHF